MQWMLIPAPCHESARDHRWTLSQYRLPGRRVHYRQKHTGTGASHSGIAKIPKPLQCVIHFPVKPADHWFKVIAPPARVKIAYCDGRTIGCQIMFTVECCEHLGRRDSHGRHQHYYPTFRRIGRRQYLAHSLGPSRVSMHKNRHICAEC